MITGDELSEAFATECLGWVYKQGQWWSCWDETDDYGMSIWNQDYTEEMNYTEYDWHPDKDLNQAVLYAGRWVRALGWQMDFKISGDSMVSCTLTHGDDSVGQTLAIITLFGQGTTTPEKMASALLQCCIEVARNEEAKELSHKRTKESD